ncbi:hypothetical protein MT325_M714L [Paramecium bursaria chlorella virus MT325]|uniref:Uncharacterized protein M714L n=1 Tax=Paramecium bursaria Chlorella virus MT325 TaxID=346932 RepID=A7IV94_PBCVM|nr:hypothetical protein MT325_M714L [Paramecium bursaria chlorella virus MT325]
MRFHHFRYDKWSGRWKNNSLLFAHKHLKCGYSLSPLFLQEFDGGLYALEFLNIFAEPVRKLHILFVCIFPTIGFVNVDCISNVFNELVNIAGQSVILLY